MERAAAEAVGRTYRPYLLANEPGFTSTASQYTFDKFRAALSARYNGSIAILNQKWNATYAGFGQIPSEVPATPPPALGTILDPLSRPSVTARWSDWARFNNARVTSWFALMR